MKNPYRLSAAIAVLLFTVKINAQTTGTVFRDYNANGTQGATATNTEPGVAGIIVNAFNSSDILVASYTTTATGTFSIPLTGSTYSGTPGSNTGSVASATAVRLEFIIPPAVANVCGLRSDIDYSAGNGNGVGSSVRFITGGTTAVNYAIQNPADYIGTATNPLTFTVRHTNGDPVGGNASGIDALLGFQYNNTGTTAPSRTLTAATLGSTWGLAYSRQADRMYAAAYVKRHFGLLGSSGQLFIISNLATGTITATPFFDFDRGVDNTAGTADDIPTRYNGSVGAITYGTAGHYTITGTAPNQTITYNGTTDPVSGLPAGLGVIGTNNQRGLGNTNQSSNDPAAFGQIGRVGLGDIEISDDGWFLYVVNLYDRKIYRLTLNSPTNPTTVTSVTSYSLPTPPLRSTKSALFANTYTGANDNISFYNGTRGYQRPFGLKFWRGKVYVAATTTGEGIGAVSTQDNNTGNPEYTDLWAYVWEFDASSASFNTTPVLWEPLNFNRGINGDGANETWKPWTSTLQGWVTTGTQPNDSRFYYYAQPMFTGIEFDNDGSMILGFRDRFGDQSGYDQRPLTGTGSGFNGGTPNLSLAIDGIGSGDILRAYRNPAGCVFVMEANGTAGGITGSAGNGQGPSNYSTNNGEFYFRDGIEWWNGSASGSTLWHFNTPEGALAILPGDRDVATTAMDPMALWSNGISKMRNTNGQNPADYQLFSGTTREALGKASALGDLEMLLAPAPLEIGNRVWNDANGNGIQDAGEAGLANVTIELFLDANNDGIPDGAAVGTVTTDANGSFLFRNDAGADVLGIDYGVIIQPSQNYLIRVASADWNSATGLGSGDLAGYQLTRTDKVGTGATDLSDNDASLTSGATIVPQIRVTTGTAGQNNHNLDFGFKTLASIGDKVWRDDDKDGIQDTGEPGVAGVTVTLYQNGPDGLPGTTDDIVVGTTVTDAYGNYLFDNLAPSTNNATQYSVGFTPPANYQFTTQTNTQTTGTNNTTNVTNTSGGSTAANGSDVNATTGRTGSFWLTGAETELTVDAGLVFGQPTTNSIGDKVWFDTDGDGVQDTNEAGVSGVTVTLYASDGVTVVATTITDANGNYIFTGLPANTNYIVGVTPPTGMVLTSTSGTTSGNTTTNSDFSQSTYKTTTVNTGAAGTQITGIDAGLVQQPATTASLGDKVWLDLNNNGVQDAGEPGVAGVTVNLYRDANGDGLINGAELSTPYATTVTDAFGNYIFNNLPAVAGGTAYQAGFVLPSGYSFVTPNTGSDDFKDSDANTFAGGYTGLYFLKPGQRNLSVDAGLVQTAPAGTARLGDKVWFDADADGVQDAGETGVAGVTVTLYNNLGVAIATTTTDANGNYLFANLAAGDYSVGFSNLPQGYSLTPVWSSNDANATNSDANPGTGRTGTITLSAGEQELDVDAGLVAGVPSGLGSLGNKVWWDVVTNNNIQDAGEPGVPGITVNLDYDINGDGDFADAGEAGFKTTTTNALGEYLFTGLSAGGYQVRFSNLPTGSNTVTQNSGTNDAVDSDGSAVTNATGASVSTTGVYNLAAGEDNLTVDLGLINTAKGSLGNRVWFDNGAGGGTANDGIQNGTEQGVAGVMVTLTNAAGQLVDRNGNLTTTPVVTTTDANGNYVFADLAAGASFAVKFSNLPAGFDATTLAGTGGADDNRSDGNLTNYQTPAVTIVANTHNPNLDLGITSTRAALGNFVWMDDDGDGVQDAGEPGIAGVTVTLYRPGFGPDGIAGNVDDALPVASLITDQNGQYLFSNLVAGTYEVEFSTIPGGTAFTQRNTPGDNGNNTNSDAVPVTGNPSVARTTGIVLSAGEADLTVDAGLFKPRAVIGNYVWVDSNNDGVQQATEPPASGILVSLIDAGGNVVALAITDANGNYLFPNVAPGTYSISFTNLPTGTSFTTANTGDDNFDSDVVGTTITGIVVTPTTVNLSFDAGIVGFITLPVRLEFTAVKSGSTALLNWVVSAERDVKSYTLEHSANNQQYFEVIRFIADGRTTYNTTDGQPFKGTNFYRVRIENTDGSISYSEVRIVRFEGNGTITVFPNPVKDRLNIQLPDSWQGKQVRIDVVSIAGQILQTKTIGNAAQTESLSVANLPVGVYHIRISNAAGEMEVKKVQKN